MNLWRHTAFGGLKKGMPMPLIADDRYFQLVRVLTDEHTDTDYAGLGHAVLENRIQLALAEIADIYPASSADCDPDHPAIVMHGEEPSKDLVAEVELMLAALDSVRLH